MQILNYQKPNPNAYGQKGKKRLFDRFGGSQVGGALMPQGMSREDMPLQAPPRMPELPRHQSGVSKPIYAQKGDQLLGLGGMFKSVIPDRVGDEWAQMHSGNSPQAAMPIPNSGGKWDDTYAQGWDRQVPGHQQQGLSTGPNQGRNDARRKRGKKYYRTD